MYLLDDLGGISHVLSVGLRLALNAGLAALEWVQSWQCSLSNVGNRLTFIPASGPELPRNETLRSCCGNVPVYWMEAYPGGPCSSRVRHVHPVQQPWRPPISNSVARPTPLLPGVQDYSRFFGSRLWNRSVFKISSRV